MEHSFNIDIAKKYGIPCAVLLKNIYFWIEKNKANGDNFYDGFYWTYNSMNAFAKLFPYLNQRQIDYALKKLIDDGILITGNYNKMAYDRTLWYAITKKGYSILQNCEMETTKFVNGKDKNVEAIPNSKKDNKLKDINTNIKDIFDYWNSKEIVVHKTLTQTFIKAIDKALKKYSVEEIKKYIDRYNTVLKDTTYFFDTKWTIDKFLTQSNAIGDFTDEGSKWLSYLHRQEKTFQSKTAIHFASERTYTKEELDALLDSVDDIKF